MITVETRTAEEELREHICCYSGEELDDLFKEIRTEGMPPCSCSSLSDKTDYRCGMHPEARARTMAERYDFEHDWDARYDGRREW